MIVLLVLANHQYQCIVIRRLRSGTVSEDLSNWQSQLACCCSNIVRGHASTKVTMWPLEYVITFWQAFSAVKSVTLPGGRRIDLHLCRYCSCRPTVDPPLHWRFWTPTRPKELLLQKTRWWSDPDVVNSRRSTSSPHSTSSSPWVYSIGFHERRTAMPKYWQNAPTLCSTKVASWSGRSWIDVDPSLACLLLSFKIFWRRRSILFGTAKREYLCWWKHHWAQREPVNTFKVPGSGLGMNDVPMPFISCAQIWTKALIIVTFIKGGLVGPANANSTAVFWKQAFVSVAYEASYASTGLTTRNLAAFYSSGSRTDVKSGSATYNLAVLPTSLGLCSTGNVVGVPPGTPVALLARTAGCSLQIKTELALELGITTLLVYEHAQPGTTPLRAITSPNAAEVIGISQYDGSLLETLLLNLTRVTVTVTARPSDGSQRQLSLFLMIHSLLVLTATGICSAGMLFRYFLLYIQTRHLTLSQVRPQCRAAIPSAIYFRLQCLFWSLQSK